MMHDVFILTVLFLFVIVTVEGTKCNSWRDCTKCEHPLLDRYCDNHHCTCVVNQGGKKCVRLEDCVMCPITMERACTSRNHCVCRPKPDVDLMGRYCKKWHHCEFCPRHYYRECINNDCICRHLTDKCEKTEDCKICRPPFETDCGADDPGIGDLCLCRTKGFADLLDSVEEHVPPPET